MCVCECVCVRERERGRERESVCVWVCVPEYLLKIKFFEFFLKTGHVENHTRSLLSLHLNVFFVFFRWAGGTVTVQSLYDTRLHRKQ